MPEAKEGESMDSWMKRCMPTFLKEHPEAESNQAVAVCLDMARRKGIKGAPAEKK